MKTWMAVAAGVLVLSTVAMSHGAPPSPDVLGMLPGIREVEVVRLQRKLMALVKSGTESTYDQELRKALTPAQYEAAKRLSQWPVAVAAHRYAHQELLAMPTLSATQRSMLEPLVRRVETAGGTDVTAVEKRMWLMAALMLTADQMQALTPRLPLPLRHGPDPNNYFSLPGLTAAQATRVKARFLALEAEMGPTIRRVKMLEEQKKIDDLMSIREEVTGRMADLEDDLAATLTPPQRAALASLPPLTSAPELQNVLGSLMDHLQPTPSQAQQLQTWVLPLQEKQREIEPQAHAIEKRLQGDTDSMSAMMEMKGLQSQMMAEQWQVARRLVEVLSDEQRADWVLKWSNR